MGSKIKTFVGRTITNADFVDGKFTILENDANTQAVIRDVRVSDPASFLKLWDGEIKVGELSSMSGYEMIDTDHSLTLELQKNYPIGISLQSLDAEKDLVLPSSEIVNAPNYTGPLITTASNMPVYRRILLPSKTDMLVSYLTGSAEYEEKGTNAKTRVEIAHYKLSGGEWSHVASFDAAYFQSILGKTTSDLPWLEEDLMTEEVYVLSARGGVDENALARWDSATEGFIAVSTNPVLINVAASLPIGMSACNGLAAIGLAGGDFVILDLNTGHYDTYDIDFNVYTASKPDYRDGGIFLIKDGEEPDRYIVGAFGDKPWYHYVTLPTPIGTTHTLDDVTEAALFSLAVPSEDIGVRCGCFAPNLFAFCRWNTGELVIARISAYGDVEEIHAVDLGVNGYDTSYAANYCFPYDMRLGLDNELEFQLAVTGVEITED